MNAPASRPFWLLTATDAREANVFTTRLFGGGRALPVFSFEDEARMFLDLGVARDGWRVEEATAEELVSMLLGPRADIGTVLLDPLPGLDGLTAGLVGVPRDAFVDHQLNRSRRPGALREDQAGSAPGPGRALVRF